PGRTDRGRGLRLAHPRREAAAAPPLRVAQADLRRESPLGDGARRGEPEARAAPPPRREGRSAAAAADLVARPARARYDRDMKLRAAILSLIVAGAASAAEHAVVLRV